jgi:hypothetical protein
MADTVIMRSSGGLGNTVKVRLGRFDVSAVSLALASLGSG